MSGCNTRSAPGLTKYNLNPVENEEGDREGEEEGAASSSIFSDMSVYMQKVITDSFCSQINETASSGKFHDK